MPDQPSMPPKLTRKLAVIMFTDIAGYTKLMGAVANKALELVRQSLQIQKPLVEKYNERNEINRIFNEKLEQYHVNNELKWLALK